jgi:hypothetical protein
LTLLRDRCIIVELSEPTARLPLSHLLIVDFDECI